MTPRKILIRCEIAIDIKGSQVIRCDEPAVAVWEWESGHPLYVCEKHDVSICVSEEIDYGASY